MIFDRPVFLYITDENRVNFLVGGSISLAGGATDKASTKVGAFIFHLTTYIKDLVN